MESHTDALEIVCKYFKQEYGTECLTQLKREKNRLASQNYRLRKKVEKMSTQLDNLMQENERMFITRRKLVMQIQRVRNNVAALPYL